MGESVIHQVIHGAILLALMLLASPTVAAAAAAMEVSTKPAELQTLRDRFAQLVLPLDPDAREKIIAQARENIRTQRDDGSWDDVDYQAQERARWKARLHLARALQLAKAFRLEQQRRGKMDEAL